VLSPNLCHITNSKLLSRSNARAIFLVPNNKSKSVSVVWFGLVRREIVSVLVINKSRPFLDSRLSYCFVRARPSANCVGVEEGFCIGPEPNFCHVGVG
jgi:hypothetical protein